MKNITYKAWAKAQMIKQSVKENFNSFLHDEQGDAGPIIIGVIVIVIAVGLAIIFRDQLGAWLSSLFGHATEEMSNAMSAPDVTPSTF